MNGIYAEKVVRDNVSFWTVKDAKTNQIISVGPTISSAVENYETALENEKMAEELGVSMDDMDL